MRPRVSHVAISRAHAIWAQLCPKFVSRTYQEMHTCMHEICARALVTRMGPIWYHLGTFGTIWALVTRMGTHMWPPRVHTCVYHMGPTRVTCWGQSGYGTIWRVFGCGHMCVPIWAHFGSHVASWGEVATAYGAFSGESPTRVAKSQIGRKLATLWRTCYTNGYTFGTHM